MKNGHSRWLGPVMVAAAVAMLMVGTSSGLVVPRLHESQEVHLASVGESTLSRCALQVSDTGKRFVAAGSTAVDTANFVGDPAGVSAASATPVHKAYGGVMKTVWDAPSSDTSYLGAIPSVTGFDSGTAANPTVRTTATWAKTPDVPNATPQSMTATSADGGQTWTSATTVSGDLPSFGVPLRDGRTLSVGFKPIAFNGGSVTMPASITDSTGDPATSSTVVVTYEDVLSGAGGPLAWLRTAGNPIQRTDGAVLVPLYGADPASTGHSIVAFVVATPASGTDPWVFRPLRSDMSQPISPTNAAATVGANNPALSFTETALLERPDGSLIAVIRNLVTTESSGSDALKWTSSANGGVTWSARYNVTGTLAGWNGNGSPQPAGYQGGVLPGINPHLELLTNGMIVLSAGKPDNWIAASATGDASGWTGQYTYRNCPTTEVTPSRSYYSGNDPDQWRYGSSGNTSIVAIDSKRVMQYGDNCHNYHWGCVRTAATTYAAQAGQSPYTVDLTSRIWQRQVDVVTPNVGKLDLAGMRASGALTVDTNLTFTSPAHPRAGVGGAFDGSRRYWSSAVSDGAGGTMTLDLGKTYTLNRVGLSLRPQAPASATVEVSTDNTTWTTVTSRSNAVTRALTYSDVSPVAARYVKVTLPAVSGCDDGLSSTCAFLNEIELYSTVDGFENDPWGNYPRGADSTQAASQVWITSDTSSGSHQALRLSDAATNAQARISFAATAAATKTLVFRVKPIAWATNAGGGFLFSLSSGTTAAAMLAVFSDGSIHAYSGGSYGAALVAPGTVPLGAWSTITVSRTASNTTLRVGTGPTVNVPVASAPATVNGYTFASSGTVPQNDQVLVDDVEFR